MIRRTAVGMAALLLASVLGMTACSGDERQPSADVDADTQSQTATSEETADEGGDDDFNRSGVVMMLESQLGAFGGTGHWDDDVLIMTFEDELDGGDGLDLAFVCGIMDGLVLDEHVTAVQTPSGRTDCAS